MLELLAGLGHEDLKGHVESGCKWEDVAGLDRKVEKEASAEMFLYKGEGNWHFLSISTRARC